jgi:hypothetical protein
MASIVTRLAKVRNCITLRGGLRDVISREVGWCRAVYPLDLSGIRTQLRSDTIRSASILVIAGARATLGHGCLAEYAIRGSAILWWIR